MLFMLNGGRVSADSSRTRAMLAVRLPPAQQQEAVRKCQRGTMFDKKDAIFHPKKGRQMRNALLAAAVCSLASPPQAHAGEIDCNGYRYGMKVRDVVTLDINNKKAPA